MDARPHTETCRTRLEEELAKDNGPRWLKAKAREMARDAADAGLARAREEMEKRRKTDAEEELGRDDVEGRSSDNTKSHEVVEPSSSKDHVRRPETLRERPAESEEEDEHKEKPNSRCNLSKAKRSSDNNDPQQSES